MGQAASSSNPTQLPRGVTKKFNNSLYEFHEPSIGAPEVDIIFFHGLQLSDYKDAYWKTWSSDGETIWPATLLGEALPNARIFSVSYDSSARKSARGGQCDLEAIAEVLVQDIIESNTAFVGQGQRPVVLVGHSLGGIVIKKFILKAFDIRNACDSKKSYEESRIQTIDNFLNNFCGVFYYATPHHGSKLADIAVKFLGNSEVLLFLKTLSRDTERLNESFRMWRARHNKRASTIGEGLPTNLRNPILAAIWEAIWGSEIIVTEASGRADTDKYYTAVNDDHITISKPKSITDNTFSLLYEFINTNVSSLTKSAENPQISMEESPC